MTRFFRLFVLGILIGLLLALTVKAQAPPAAAAPPVLSELDRLKLVTASQQVEIWQLKLQQAATEYQKAQAELARQIAAVTPDGWQLTDKLEFVRKDK